MKGKMQLKIACFEQGSPQFALNSASLSSAAVASKFCGIHSPKYVTNNFLNDPQKNFIVV